MAVDVVSIDSARRKGRQVGAPSTLVSIRSSSTVSDQACGRRDYVAKQHRVGSPRWCTFWERHRHGCQLGPLSTRHSR